MKILRKSRECDARGFAEGNSPSLAICVRMTPELFALVDHVARREGVSFAEASRRLLMIGIGTMLAAQVGEAA